MSQVNQFEDLRIWQQARKFCKDIHMLVERFERLPFSVKNQIYRSSGSVMDNIAEGFERNGNKEFRQFLSIAKASCGEARSQLYRIEDLVSAEAEEFARLRGEAIGISRGIQSLMNYLKDSVLTGSKFKEPQSEYGSETNLKP